MKQLRNNWIKWIKEYLVYHIKCGRCLRKAWNSNKKKVKAINSFREVELFFKCYLFIMTATIFLFFYRLLSIHSSEKICLIYNKHNQIIPLTSWQYTSSWGPACWACSSPRPSCPWWRRLGSVSSPARWPPPPSSSSRPCSRSCCGTFSSGPRILIWSLALPALRCWCFYRQRLLTEPKISRFMNKRF